MDHTVKSLIFHPLLDAFRSEQKYFDVDVRIGDRTFKSHRLLLAMLSRYFDDQFRGKAGTGDVIETVVLENVDASAFQEILNVMYTGEFGIIDDFYAVLKACDILEVRSKFVEDECIIVSRKKKPMQNVFTLLKYAHDTKKMNLFESLKQNIHSCAEYFFFRDDSFLELPYNLLIRIFESGFKYFISNKNGDRFADVFLRWIYHSRGERQKHLKVLMAMVKWDLSPMYMREMFVTLCDGLLDTDRSATVLKKIMNTLPRCTTRYEDEKLLNIYIRMEDVGFIRELSRGHGTCWSPLKKLPLWDTMKKSGIDDQVYCLTYGLKGGPLQTFSRSSLTGDSKDLKLRLPPHTLSNFQMHPLPIEKLIYVYDEDMRNIGKRNSDGVLIFDSRKNYWYAAPPMIEGVRDACMAVDEDSIYLIGGETTTAPIAQAFQHRTQTWRLLEKPGYVFTSAECSCCIHQGKLYLTDNRTDSFHCYDIRAGKWELLPNYNSHLTVNKLISFDNKLWAIGRAGEENLAIEYCYDVSERRWSVSPFLFFQAVMGCWEDEYHEYYHFVIKDCVVF